MTTMSHTKTYKTKLNNIKENANISNATTPENNQYITASDYEYESNCLYCGKNREQPILIGMVTVIAQVKVDDGSYQTLLRAKNPRNEEVDVLVDSASLTAQSVNTQLGNHGLTVFNPNSVLIFIKHLITIVSSKPAMQGVFKVGWHQNRQIFFTGEFAIFTPATRMDEFYLKPLGTNLLRMRQKGTLVEWKAQIGVHVEANDILLVFTSLSLASVLLDRAQLSSSVFNLFGYKGLGKTLVLQASASVWGNGCDPAQSTPNNVPFIQKVNSTANGLEALLSTYSPLATIVDELGERKATDLAELCYSLASGAGKHRMTSNGNLAASGQWLSNVLISSERSISELIASSGKQQEGGQADRAVDIPIPEDGIFTDCGKFGDFNLLTSHLKKVASEYYGSAGVEFIQHCLTNPDAVQGHINFLSEIEDMLAPSECEAGERRVVKRFALGCVAGLIAIDAGIFSCETDRLLDAFESVVKLWWNFRADCIRKIVELLTSNKVNIVDNAPLLGNQNNDVFHHNGLFTFSVVLFEKHFSNHAHLLKELNGFGMIKREQATRFQHRYCNNRFFGYSIFDARLLPLLKIALDETEEQSLEDAFS